MVYVNVGELKNRLSYYLRLVRQGEPVLIKDRDRVVARLEPVAAPDESAESEQITRLIALGVLAPARVELADIDFGARPKMKASLLDEVLKERQEGY